MTEGELDARESALAQITREAAELARQLYSNPQGVKLKGKQDYITAADGEVERLVVGRIAERFPQDAVLGEEGGASVDLSRKSDAVWIIDPIDGTANFAHRIPHFCISIGFLSGGDAKLGTIAAPMYGEVFRARRGRGAYCNERRMKVAEPADMNRAIIELGWSVRRPARAYTALLERVLASGATFLRAGSGALGLAYVADGRTHGYCELHINAWDVAAGLLIVQEAGGWTNDFFAGEALKDGNPVLACAPGLRDTLISVTGVGQTHEKLERRIS